MQATGTSLATAQSVDHNTPNGSPRNVPFTLMGADGKRRKVTRVLKSHTYKRAHEQSHTHARTHTHTRATRMF